MAVDKKNKRAAAAKKAKSGADTQKPKSTRKPPKKKKTQEPLPQSDSLSDDEGNMSTFEPFEEATAADKVAVPEEKKARKGRKQGTPRKSVQVDPHISHSEEEHQQSGDEAEEAGTSKATTRKKTVVRAEFNRPTEMKLLEFIKNHPILWHSSQEDHENTDNRDTVCDLAGDSIGESGELFKSIKKTLYDRND